MNVLRLTKKQLEKIGHRTILGRCAVEGFMPDVPLAIEIEQATDSWRRENDGPDWVLIPEHVVGCLMDDMLQMTNMGYKITISHFEQDPQ